jgi:hypothetical protein
MDLCRIDYFDTLKASQLSFPDAKNESYKKKTAKELRQHPFIIKGGNGLNGPGIADNHLSHGAFGTAFGGVRKPMMCASSTRGGQSTSNFSFNSLPYNYNELDNDLQDFGAPDTHQLQQSQGSGRSIRPVIAPESL